MTNGARQSRSISPQQFGQGPIIGPTKEQRAPSRLPQQPEISERSLQINIDSSDDAKSVIQNLGKIKAAFESAGVNSVEFCIAESVVRDVESTLLGAVNWCRTYVKHVAPFPGNVLFPLPSYRELTPVRPPEKSTAAPPEPALASSPAQAPLSLGAKPETPVKPTRPVRADHRPS